MRMILLFILLSLPSFGLDISRLNNELKLITDQKSEVTPLKKESFEVEENLAKQKQQILDLEKQYFQDEINTKLAAPKRKK
jgi:hypothetical protein